MRLLKRLVIIAGVIMAVLLIVLTRLVFAIAGRGLAWFFAGCLLVSAYTLWVWDKAVALPRRLRKQDKAARKMNGADSNHHSDSPSSNS